MSGNPRPPTRASRIDLECVDRDVCQRIEGNTIVFEAEDDRIPGKIERHLDVVLPIIRVARV